MSIRAIDMQLTVPKTIDYARQQQGEINKQNMDQQLFAQAAQKQAEQKPKIVIETKESEQTVNKDGRNRQEQGKNKNRKGHSASDSDDGKKKETTGLFDMRI